MTALKATQAPMQPATRWPLADALHLAALTTAVPCARLHARLIITEWGMPDIAHDTELITSELITNAVHASANLTGPAPPVIRLRLLSDRTRIIIEAADPVPFPPPPASHPSPDDESGRGLLIVSTLATQWGTSRTPGWPGKIIWAELHRHH